MVKIIQNTFSSAAYASAKQILILSYRRKTFMEPYGMVP